MKKKPGDIPITDIANGFTYNDTSKRYTCMFCGMTYEDGDICVFDSRMVEARKAIRLHIAKEHGNVFEAILAADEWNVGLTDVQKDLLLRFYSGAGDKEIAAETGLSPSTIRYQRHSFREKAKQARWILALSALLEERLAMEKPAQKQTNDTDEKVEAFFASMSPLVLKTLNVKRKNQLLILDTIARQFEAGRGYTEPEVNAILATVYADVAGLRRALIDAGLMRREKDGSVYCLCE